MSRYVSPVFEINDINGAPQVGAKLVFYTPGTTNPKTIYSDAGLTTPRTNPVTAVSSNAGAIYPNIYLDGVYDVVQQDASGTVDTDDGVALWTRDDVGATSEGALSLWLAGTTYSIPEIVLGSDDEYYRSLVDANQGNDPTSSDVQWERLRFGRIFNVNTTYAQGDRVLIESKTASASVSLDFITGITSEFTQYILEIINLVPASSVDIYLRFSDDGGSTFKSGASDYAYGSDQTSASAAFIPISVIATAISNTASHGGICGRATVYNPALVSVQTNCVTNITQASSATAIFSMYTGGSYVTAATIDGFQIIAESGNLTSGTVNLWGIQQ